MLNVARVLKQARETWGNKNQIMVAAEECCELASKLMKYPRYDTHQEAIERTRDSVLEEYADVIVILDHVTNIYEFTPEEVGDAIAKKVSRVKKWLETGKNMQVTTEIRN